MNSPVPTPVPPLKRQERGILVVEDDVIARYTLAKWLRGRNYVVMEAASADEALTLLGTGQGIELVITDIQMPGSLDGIGLASYIKAKHAGIKVIIVSGKALPRREGGTVFFRKPYDLNQLTECVKKLLDG